MQIDFKEKIIETCPLIIITSFPTLNRGCNLSQSSPNTEQLISFPSSFEIAVMNDLTPDWNVLTHVTPETLPLTPNTDSLETSSA